MSKNIAASSSLPLSVSQNFLTRSATIRRLLRLTSIEKSDHVVEIGAGKGHITRELVKICHAVDAFEIDPKLCEQLRGRLGNADSLSIKAQDFLKAPLPQNGEYKVFANIPFSITTQIVRKLTASGHPPQEAWLVMEKGAAKRFMGKPRETLASIAIKPYFDIGIIYYFSRRDFHPMPAVDIVLLHLARRARPDLLPAQQKGFSDFVELGQNMGSTKT